MYKRCFTDMENRFVGESIILFAPGPTLNKFDLDAIPDGYFKCAVNGTIIHKEIRDIIDFYVWSGDIDIPEHPSRS